MSSAGKTTPIGLPAQSTLERVVDGGFCIGCGACAQRAPAAVRIVDGAYGMPVAAISRSATAQDLHRAAQVCPFGTELGDETTLATELFGDTAAAHPELGRARASVAAHVLEGDFRERGSSGGMGSWLARELVAAGHADGVVHLRAASPLPNDARADQALFSFAVDHGEAEIRSGAKSRYYPAPLHTVLAQLAGSDKRYVFVAVPCVIKAIRLLARTDARFATQVAFCIGLVCGHMKTRRFAELLAWQMGVPPAQLAGFDFRHKLPGADANRYGVAATHHRDGALETEVQPARALFGTDWGLGFFKPKACDYCDDVVAELADVTVGDAWLPQFVADARGTNIVIARHPLAVQLLAQGRAEGRIWSCPLSADEVVRSQAAGFAHRREGLAYRLAVQQARGAWTPGKRIEARAFDNDPRFRRKHELRMALARESHRAFDDARRQGQLAVFLHRMAPLVESYRDLDRSLPRRIAARLRRLWRTKPQLPLHCN